jgi:hypothetical protein
MGGREGEAERRRRAPGRRKKRKGKRKNDLYRPDEAQGSESVSDLRLSPDGETRVIAYHRRAKTPSEIVPSYVTDTGYTTDLPARTKTGDAQSASRAASISHRRQGAVAEARAEAIEPARQPVKRAAKDAGRSHGGETEAKERRTATSG